MACLYDEKSERCVIGALLQSPNAYSHLARLQERDMMLEAHQVIVAAMHRLKAKRQPIDVQTVDVEARCDARSQALNLTGTLIACAREVPSTANIGAYLDAVVEYSRRRQAMAAAEQIGEGLNAGEDAETVIASALHALRSISGGGSGWVEMGELVGSVFGGLEAMAAGDARYLSTGLADLDAVIGGLFPGELTVLAARPAVGKSALGAYIAFRQARQGKCVGVCSLEMSPAQYIKRLWSAQAGVNGYKLRLGRGITEADWEALGDACNEMAGLQMPFTFSVRTVEELERHARARKDERGLDLLVVDYLQLLRTAQRAESDYARISAVSGALKRLALELDIPILALAQVSRPQVKGALRPPTLDSLKGSGDIEQDADGVIFLHRPDGPEDDCIPDCDRAMARRLEAIGEQYIMVDVAKQRNGECCRFGMAFDPAHMTYACFDREG